MMTLETKRLALTLFEESHIDDLMEYRNNDEWMKFQTFKGLTKEEYQKKLLVPYDISKGVQLAIVLKENSKLIGDVFLIMTGLRIDIGYTINPHYSKQGYATEILNAVINKVQVKYPYHQLFAETDQLNIPSINLLKKVGFSEVECNEDGCVFEYKIRQLRFDDLEEYNSIEMLKKVTMIREYTNLNNYTTRETKPQIIDFAKDEKMSLWREIMVHEECGIFVIIDNQKYVAGAICVTNSPQIKMLRGNMENSVLWDIRVDSKFQHLGYGKILFNKCVEFAKSKGTKRMIIETQNNNTSAIPFYEKMGCTLLEINKNHYEGLTEDQLIFVKEF